VLSHAETVPLSVRFDHAERERRRPAMLELESAMIYRLEVSGPLASADGSDSSPRRQFWQMTRATL
jgi:hypothetical protein